MQLIVMCYYVSLVPQFSRLLTHLLRPTEALCQRVYAVELLASEPRRKDILKLTLNVSGMVSLCLICAQLKAVIIAAVHSCSLA